MSNFNPVNYTIQINKENTNNQNYSEKENLIKTPTPSENFRKSKIKSDSKCKIEGKPSLILPMIPVHQIEASLKKTIITDKPFPLLNLLSNKQFEHNHSQSYLNNFMMDHLMNRKIYEFEFQNKPKRNLYGENFLKKNNSQSLDKLTLNTSKGIKDSSLSEISYHSPLVFQKNKKISNFSKIPKTKNFVARNYPIYLFTDDNKTINNNNNISKLSFSANCNILNQSHEKTIMHTNNTSTKIKDKTNLSQAINNLFFVNTKDELIIKKAKVQLFKIKKKNYLKLKNNSVLGNSSGNY